MLGFKRIDSLEEYQQPQGKNWEMVEELLKLAFPIELNQLNRIMGA